MNPLQAVRKIRACEGEAAAQLVLEHMLNEAREEGRRCPIMDDASVRARDMLDMVADAASVAYPDPVRAADALRGMATGQPGYFAAATLATSAKDSAISARDVAVPASPETQAMIERELANMPRPKPSFWASKTAARIALSLATGIAIVWTLFVIWFGALWVISVWRGH